MNRSLCLRCILIVALFLTSLTACAGFQQPLACDEIRPQLNALMQQNVGKSELGAFISRTYQAPYQWTDTSLLWESQGLEYEARYRGDELEIVFIALNERVIDGETVSECFGAPDSYKAEVSAGNHSSIFEFNLLYEAEGLLFRSFNPISIARGAPSIEQGIEFNSIWLQYADNNEALQRDIERNYKPWRSWEKVTLQIDPALERLMP